MTVDAHASGIEGRGDSGPAGQATLTRQKWMSVLAKADTKTLAEKVAALKDLPKYSVIRPAECGSVMVRGRAGGTGSPFNLGEMSVTRCVVQLTDSEAGPVIGHAYVTGRDKHHAESAAVLDALMQTERWRPTIQEGVIGPLAHTAAEAKQARQEKVAATKVNFFTMVRGEN